MAAASFAGLTMDEKKIRKRNAIFLLIEGSFFTAGVAFMDVNAVIPVFIYSYTNSTRLAGLATTINLSASIIMQLLIGPYVKSIRNVPRYITIVMFLFRPLMFLMLPLLLLDLNPWLIVGLFLFIYALIWCGDGLLMNPWTDLFSRTVEPEKRGTLLGYQQLFGGIGALIAGFVVKSVMDHPMLDQGMRYAVIFGGAAVCLTCSSIAMAFCHDLPRPIPKEKQNPRQYYRSLPIYFRNHKAFKKVVLTRIFSITNQIIAPFVILFAQNQLGLQPDEVSTLILIQITGSLIGGVIWGRISRRYGNQRVILTSQIIGLLLALSLSVFSIASLRALPAYFVWPLVLCNGMNMTSWIGFMNHTLDIVDDEERTIYLLISNVMTFPFTFLTFLSGLVVQHIGYLPIFLTSTLAAILAVRQAARLGKQADFQDQSLYSRIRFRKWQ